MTRWIGQGLRTGIKTTAFPKGEPSQTSCPPVAVRFNPAGLSGGDAAAAVEVCPTTAISAEAGAQGRSVRFDAGQCVLCGRCVRAFPRAFSWVTDPRVAVRSRAALRGPGREREGEELGRLAAQVGRAAKPIFRRSLHIRHVDAGSCNGCEAELQLLSSPYYDLQRLGFFFTPTPRHADVLLVTGVVTGPMEGPLRRTFEAMPHPKLVVAAGVCAIGGGAFAASPLTRGPLDQILPVDVYIPGCPPSPLALLHGLLLAVSRARERYQPVLVSDGA